MRAIALLALLFAFAPLGCASKGCTSIGCSEELKVAAVHGQAAGPEGIQIKVCRNAVCATASPDAEGTFRFDGLNFGAYARPSLTRSDVVDVTFSFVSLQENDLITVDVIDAKGATTFQAKRRAIQVRDDYANGPECGVTCNRARFVDA